MVDPLVGRLPDDCAHPEGEVRCHEVHEAEPGKEAEAFDDDGRVDKEEMHLQEGEECLFDGSFRQYWSQNSIKSITKVPGGSDER